MTATLASIGAAAVPGAGMVMPVIVLAQAGIPEAGLALIFAIDRPLDMCRTVIILPVMPLYPCWWLSFTVNLLNIPKK